MTVDRSSATAPLVSVIMPAYQAEATIGASISGVLTQTYPNVELVVVDDGSTDRTEAICRSYGDLIRYERKDNGGSASARNHAFGWPAGSSAPDKTTRTPGTTSEPRETITAASLRQLGRGHRMRRQTTRRSPSRRRPRERWPARTPHRGRRRRGRTWR